jgi:peptidoglycan/LPS O-acetylase OafA/YrhL
MALEEQFYLTWPLVVWFAKDRKTLLKVTLSICALCWMIRLIAPWIHISPTRGYYATPTRVDAILFGVALALVADHEIYKRYQYLAKYVAIIGSILWLLTFINHPDYPDNYYRLVLDCSFGNFIVLAVIVAALEEGSAFARFLSVRWVCWLGQMSYALYTFHFTYHAWFLNSLRPMLERYIAEPGAFILTLTLALALTIALGMLSLRFVELPALSLKRYFTYGRESLDPSNALQADKEISLSRPAAQDAPDVPAELTEAHSAVSKREFGAAGLLH